MATSLTLNIRDIPYTWVTGTNYSFNIDKGLVQEIGGQRFLSDTQTNILSIVTPSNTPYIESVVPANNSTDIALPLIQLNFDRFVFENTGSFYLYKETTGADELILTLPIEDSKVTTQANVVSIDLTQENTIFEGGEKYYITSDASVVDDIYHLENAAIGPTEAVFTYKVSPFIATVSPTLGAINIEPPNIALTFNREVTERSGNFYLYKNTTGTDTLVATLPVGDSRVTGTGTNVNINLSADYALFEAAQTYYITADDDSYRDAFNLPFKEIADDTVIKFTYIDVPEIVSVSPSYGTSDVVNSVIRLTYNRSVFKNTGNFYLYREAGSTDELVLTVPVENNRVSIAGAVCSIDLSNDDDIFVGGDTYYLTYDAEVLRDEFFLKVAALTTDTTVKFIYLVKPSVTGVSPAYASTGTYTSRLIVSFNRQLSRGDGNFYIYDMANTSTALATIAATNTSIVSVTGTDITITYTIPEGDCYLAWDYGVAKDLDSIRVAAVTDNSVLRFTQRTVTDMETRIYADNNENLLFSTSTPTILDPSTASFVISLSSPEGEFADDSFGTNKSTNWVFTGTSAQVYNKLATVRFFPTKDFTGETTYTYTQSKAGFPQVNRTKTLSRTVGGIIPTQTYTFTSTNATSWTPEYRHVKYGAFDVLVVGGGSGGKWGATFGTEGGGGGGGGFIEKLNIPLPLKSHTVKVGPGGVGAITTSSLASNGGTSTFDTFVSFGGGGVWVGGYRSDVGDSSGLPTYYDSSQDGPYPQPSLASGAGAGGKPYLKDIILNPGSTPIIYSQATFSGPGLRSRITGSYYASGGGSGGYISPIDSYASEGGGGTGGYHNNTTVYFSQAGTPNSGGGGGGGGSAITSYTGYNPLVRRGANGGSGVIVVKAHPIVTQGTSTTQLIMQDTFTYYNEDSSLNTGSIFVSAKVIGELSYNAPTGNVVLSDSSRTLGINSLIASPSTYESNSTISWKPSDFGFSIGTSTINLSYSGDAKNASSTISKPLTLTKAVISNIALSFNPKIATYSNRMLVGEPLTINATKSSYSLPNNISFVNALETSYGSAAFTGNTATVTITTTASGTLSAGISYPGDDYRLPYRSSNSSVNVYKLTREFYLSSEPTYILNAQSTVTNISFPGGVINSTSYSPLPSNYSYTGTLPTAGGSVNIRTTLLNINGQTLRTSVGSGTYWLCPVGDLTAVLKSISVASSVFASSTLSQSEVLTYVNSISGLQYYLNGVLTTKPTITTVYADVALEYTGDVANNSSYIKWIEGGVFVRTSLRKYFGA